MKDIFKRLGARAPRLTSEIGKVRQRLIQAGYRNDETLAVFYGIRFAVAIAFFALLATPVIIKPNIMVGLAGSLLGYVLPGMVLARLARRRQHEIQLSLADAVDLLVVSVEAGLGLDQALLRVGGELAVDAPRALGGDSPRRPSSSARGKGAPTRSGTSPTGRASKTSRRS